MVTIYNGLVASYVVGLRNKCVRGEKPPNIGGSWAFHAHAPPPPFFGELGMVL